MLHTGAVRSIRPLQRLEPPLWQKRKLASVTELREHRKIPYSIPNNNDGVWGYKIHPGHLKPTVARPRHAATDGYETRAEAITAAELAIHDWLGPALR